MSKIGINNEQDEKMLARIRHFKEMKQELGNGISSDFFTRESFRPFIEDDYIHEVQACLAYY